jgi:hypothetical protein
VDPNIDELEWPEIIIQNYHEQLFRDKMPYPGDTDEVYHRIIVVVPKPK